MTAKLLLRVAATMMLLHTIGHTIGALSWKNNPVAKIASLIKEMERNHFNFMGRSSTLASFYQGYGLIMIIVLLLLTISLWLFSNQEASVLTRQLLMLFGVFLVSMSVLEYIYFFPLAAGMTLIAGICTFASLYVGPKPIV